MSQVYFVLNNADSTEGRGPMVPVACFTSFDKALEFLSKQPGVMGRMPHGIDSDIQTWELNNPKAKPVVWRGWNHQDELGKVQQK